MGLFKTEEEKRLLEEKRLKKEQEKIKELENKILNELVFYGKVGQIHQGLSTLGLWGVMDNGKTKFNSTRFEIFDDKLIIERNRNIVHFSDIKELFQDKGFECIIILENGTGIPIRANSTRELTAFINVLNKLIETNRSKSINESNNINENKTTGNSEDKFDKLIKLGEMHDKGLLSDEEFVSLKNELLSGTNDDITHNSEDNNVEPSVDACENCGADVSPDDTFCSECGTKIN